jgi:Skp family chaperone for outer membrane proteins
MSALTRKLLKTILGVMLLSVIPIGVFASSPLYQGKEFAKETKKLSKKLKEEKWQVYDSNQPLDVAIKNYYLKLEKGNLQSLTVEAVGNNEHVALQKAQHRANAQYAAQQETYVSRDVNITVSNEVVDEFKSSSEFDQTVQTKVDQKIRSLRPEVTLIRKTSNAKVEVKMLFLISK